MFSDTELEDVRRFYDGRRDCPPTSLIALPGLAASLGVRQICIKDESDRFGLPAFKVLGVRYAVATLMAASPGTRALAAATAGNHGRAVAHEAKAHGLPAHIYVPAGTEQSRIAALKSEGAIVTVTAVPYDDTVRLMAADAASAGWTVVSDTAWDGYEQIPRWIMAGYTRMFDEVARIGLFTSTDPSSIVIVAPAGVGAFAGAVAGWLTRTFGDRRPRFVTVEPEGSACVQASLRAGARTSLERTAPTTMAPLRCAEVSTLAWPVLHDVVDSAAAVSDTEAESARRLLREPPHGDPSVRSGVCGGAGLAALLQLVRQGQVGADETALIVNTEAG